MKPLIRNYVLGFLMLTASFVSIVLMPGEKLADQTDKFNLEAVIPSAFGVWSDDSSLSKLVLSPEVQANLNKTYDQILNRTYINAKGERMMLTIAYGSEQTQDLKAHRQEVCYRAQGFNIDKLNHEKIDILGHSILVTQMTATQRDRREQVTYWFTMGNKVVLSRTERLLVQLKYALSGYIPDGFLVRVSNLSSESEVSYAIHQSFVEAMLSATDDNFVMRLLGQKINDIKG